MATRNRTFLFRKHRDALKSVRAPTFDGVTSSTTSSREHGVELNPFRQKTTSYAPLSTEEPSTSSKGHVAVVLPPPWVDLSEEVASNIQRARSKMSELAKAHAKALMPSFGDGKEDQHRIEALTYGVTQLIKKSERKLQKLSTNGASEDSNVRRNVQHSLATDLQSLSVELRKKQSAYLKCLEQQKEGPDGDDFELNINGGKSQLVDDDYLDPIFNEQRLARIKKNERFTIEREREIQQVVESVNEIAQVMKDLSVLVIDQGTIVDRIDYNIQNVASTVEQGLKQLQKAERSQKKGGLAKCATVLIIMCFVMLALLVLKDIIW